MHPLVPHVASGAASNGNARFPTHAEGSMLIAAVMALISSGWAERLARATSRVESRIFGSQTRVVLQANVNNELNWPVTRGERICRCRAKQRDELASLHSITSSARASSVSGKVTPSALAALRLMTSSTFVTLIPVL